MPGSGRHTALGIPLLLAVLLTLNGCRSALGPSAARSAGESALQLLVLPLNVVTPLPAELEDGSELVWEELGSYLVAHGKRVETLPLLDARRLWRRSIEATVTRGESGFDAAAKNLVLTLREQQAFDCLIVPSVFINQARMTLKSASWDGVRRRLEVEGDPRRLGSIHVTTSISGGIEAASLHLVIFDAEGNEILETQRGIDVLYRVHIEGGKSMSDLRWGFESRSPFENAAFVRDAVAGGLDPFLPPLAYDEE